MDFLTATLSGLSVSVVGLCLLRTLRARSWGSIARIPHLRDKTLEGKVVIITGGNTGLGYHTAEELTRRGASSVILACRSVSRGEAAAAQIQKSTGSTNVVQVVQLDLGCLQSVHDFAQEIKEKFPAVDFLVCNAGVWVPMEEKAKTEDGFEAHVGINHLGHFLLTNLLLDRVKRVVVVSSGLMLSGKLDLDESRQFYEGRKILEGEPVPKHAPIGYCDSKLMNAIFSRDLASRHQGVEVLCVGPGWCKTELARNVHFSWLKKILFAPIAFLFMRSATEGAQNIIHAVLEDSQLIQSGYFYRDFKLAEKENKKVDELLGDSEQLWNLSAELTKVK